MPNNRTPQQYAIVLTSLNNVAVVANTWGDHELRVSTVSQMEQIANELHNIGMVEIWHVDTQSYTVEPKKG